MTTMNRLLLLDPWGDDLRSGDRPDDRRLSEPAHAFPSPFEQAPFERDETSATTEAEPEAMASAIEDSTAIEEEPLPETLRSSVLACEPISRPIVVEIDESGDHAA